jgi:hypothetical protein
MLYRADMSLECTALARDAGVAGIFGRCFGFGQVFTHNSGPLVWLFNIWATKGMAGVRDAAKRGLVPVAAIGVLGALAQPSDQEAGRGERM